MVMIQQPLFEAVVPLVVENGAALPGLYPANAETKARYKAWEAGQGK